MAKIEPKTELERLREKMDGCMDDLIRYKAVEGQSPVIDANIRHKREQLHQLEAKIAELEGKNGQG